MSSMASVITLLFIGMLAIAGLSDAESQYSYETYTCNQCPGRVSLERRFCKPGWTGCKCETPICEPKCPGDKVCISPGQCGCLRTIGGGSSNCYIRPCRNGKRYDCYPGTCDNSDLNCTCPIQYGFTGENCLNIISTPEIESCKVRISNSANNIVLREANCAASGYNNSVNWISSSSIGEIRAIWVSSYINGPQLPGNPPVDYLMTAPIVIGVTKASFTITLLETGQNATGVCAGASENLPLKTTVSCDVSRDWTSFGSPVVVHNMIFRVTVFAQLGGQKQFKIPGSTAPVQQFIGTPASRSAVFKVDLIPPVHCLNNQSDSGNCQYFAIYLDQDIRTDPNIRPKFYNWTDDGSGIERFHVEIYKMADSDLQLENVGKPLQDSVQDVYPNGNDYTFTMKDDSGVFSIELTVYDRAGNTARARKLFIYNAHKSGLRTDPNNPAYLKEANPSTNYTWLTNFENPRDRSNIPLTVYWKDHFTSSADFNGPWGYAARPWGPNDGIDDKYGKRYGRRSIEAITTLQNGIEFYALAFVVDRNSGGRGLSPHNWVFLNSTETSYQLPINESLSDGYTIVVWIQCTDVAFSTLSEKLTIGVDRTTPEIKQQSYQLKTGQYNTNTTLSITVVDLESGIANITYRIFASGLALPLTVASPQKREPPSKRSKRAVITPCEADDMTCYCIPQGDCFNYIQTIDVDNCQIDRYTGQSFSFRYTVTSLSNRNSIEQTIELGFLSAGDIPCRPIGGLSSGAQAGIAIGVILGFLLLLLLIFILFMLLRIYYFKKPVPRRIDNIRQTFRKQLGKSYEDENAAYESSGAFSAITKKISVKFKRSNNTEGKGKNMDDDDYIYTGSEAVRNNSTHIQTKNLQMEETISNEGRFAVIKKAFLQDGNERKVVAVKALRSGFSAADVRLMEEKIQFLSGVPSQANIVNFLGASEEENNGGPIMILEYCSMPLKEWLKNNRKVTSEVLENMLTFTLNIARGVEHLHENDIVHRRLAVRNVLLTQQFGGWVAKLIGFGPNRENSEDKTKKVAVPVKWLSPETLATVNDIDPVYNQKTDVWSFAITIWEIYSLGETPYPNKNSNDAKKLIIKGLKPTKPDECPPDLYESAIQPCWETTPRNRPTMTEVCSAIEAFRSGGGGGGYYTTGDDNYDGGAYGGAHGGGREGGGGGAYGGSRGGGELYDDGR